MPLLDLTGRPRILYNLLCTFGVNKIFLCLAFQPEECHDPFCGSLSSEACIRVRLYLFVSLFCLSFCLCIIIWCLFCTFTNLIIFLPDYSGISLICTFYYYIFSNCILWYIYIYIYIYIYFYIKRVRIDLGLKSQKSKMSVIYMYTKRQTMCPPGYYQSSNGLMETHTLGHMICMHHISTWCMSKPYIMCPKTWVTMAPLVDW